MLRDNHYIRRSCSVSPPPYVLHTFSHGDNELQSNKPKKKLTVDKTKQKPQKYKTIDDKILWDLYLAEIVI